MSRSQFSALEELSHDMERVFDSLLGRTVGTVLRGSDTPMVPPADVSETDEAYRVAIDLPGVVPADVSVEVLDNQLIVSGERQAATETDCRKLRTERPTGEYRRAIPLPGEVDVAAIEADYAAGVLSITLPKVAPKQPTKIKIKTQGAD